MPETTLTRLEPDQFDAVNAMILRSKAFWGYDADMMARMETVLRLDPEAARQGRAIAAWQTGAPMGLAQISAPYHSDNGLAVMLDLLFIAPEAIGSGLGKQLYDWALEQARMADAAYHRLVHEFDMDPGIARLSARLHALCGTGR